MKKKMLLSGDVIFKCRDQPHVLFWLDEMEESIEKLFPKLGVHIQGSNVTKHVFA